jgi:hypothetical protein
LEHRFEVGAGGGTVALGIEIEERRVKPVQSAGELAVDDLVGVFDH